MFYFGTHALISMNKQTKSMGWFLLLNYCQKKKKKKWRRRKEGSVWMQELNFDFIQPFTTVIFFILNKSYFI